MLELSDSSDFWNTDSYYIKVQCYRWSISVMSCLHLNYWFLGLRGLICKWIKKYSHEFNDIKLVQLPIIILSWIIGNGAGFCGCYYTCYLVD